MRRVWLLLMSFFAVTPAIGSQPQAGPAAQAKDVAEKPGNLRVDIDYGGHTRPIDHVWFSPDGQQLISASGDMQDDTVRIWDVGTGEQRRVLHPNGLLRPFGFVTDLGHALAPDGKTMAIFQRVPKGANAGARLNDDTAIHFRSLVDGRFFRVLKNGPKDFVAAAAFSADGKRLAACSTFRECCIWDLAQETPVAHFKTSEVVGMDGLSAQRVAFSPDGNLLALYYGSDSEIYDLSAKKVLAKLPRARILGWAHDGKTLLVARLGIKDQVSARRKVGTVRLCELDGTVRLELKGTTGGGIVSADGARVVTRIGVFDAVTGKQLTAFARPIDRPMAVSADGKFIASISPDDGLDGGEVWLSGKIRINNDAWVPARQAGYFNRNEIRSPGAVHIWKTADGSPVHKLGTKTWLSGREGEAPAEPVRVGWSPDGQAITWAEGAKTFNFTEMQFGPPLDEADFPPLVKAGEPTLLDSEGRQVTAKGGDLVFRFGPKAPDRVRRVAQNEGELNLPWSVAGSPDKGRLVLVACSNQTLQIWDTKEVVLGNGVVLAGKVLLTFHVSGSDWIVWTKEGYYAASPGGERLIGWTSTSYPRDPTRAFFWINVRLDYYPGERLRKHLYRPDVIRQLLKTGDLRTALAAANDILKKDGIIVEDGVANFNNLLPPAAELRILDKKDLPRVKLKASAVAGVANQPVTSLRLLVDGRPLQGGNAQQTFGAGKNEAEALWDVTLPPGKHQLAVLARCPDSSSISNIVEVEVADPNKQAFLHVLAIGVNNYEEGTLKLEFATKDAVDLAAGFRKSSKDSLFNEVYGEVLVDARARKEAILKNLAEMRKKAKPNDLAVVYFAGHGVKEKDKFYLLPVEARTDNLAGTALSGDELRKALGEFPCQVLLMLDACHASAGLKNFRPAVDDITRHLTDDDCGVAVMCSAMAHEKALEKGGNGLFTRAVVDGLNRGEGVPYNTFDRRLYIHHLHAYVFDSVKHFSGDRQHPFLSLPWVVESFPVAQFGAK